jgi:hypothetical protein
MSTLRPSSEIEAQLEAFLATLPANVTEPPADDFAATLQWTSWQKQRQELELELKAALMDELAEADLQIAFSGDPVLQHDIKAGFLAGFLTKAQGLIKALSETVEESGAGIGRTANNPMEDYRLFVSATFPSSFGLRLRLRSKAHFETLPLSQTEVVLDRFCKLMDPNLTQEDLVSAVAVERVKSPYHELLKSISREGAQLIVRTKARLSGVTINASQAYHRALLIERLTQATAIRFLEGVLVGGSMASNRFELQVGEKLYRGRISPEAKVQMKNLKLGERVRAEVFETAFLAGEVVVEGHATYFLKGITKRD